jgi:hypothetical protein
MRARAGGEALPTHPLLDEPTGDASIDPIGFAPVNDTSSSALSPCGAVACGASSSARLRHAPARFALRRGKSGYAGHVRLHLLVAAPRVAEGEAWWRPSFNRFNFQTAPASPSRRDHAYHHTDSLITRSTSASSTGLSKMIAGAGYAVSILTACPSSSQYGCEGASNVGAATFSLGACQGRDRRRQFCRP